MRPLAFLMEFHIPMKVASSYIVAIFPGLRNSGSNSKCAATRF